MFKSALANKLFSLACEIEELEIVISHFTEQALEAERANEPGQATRFWAYVDTQKDKLEQAKKKAKYV